MENKTSKYFKYAIGEIVLVVIGILIALSINNLSEQRKTANFQNQVYQQIYNDIVADSLNLASTIKFYTENTKLIDQVLYDRVPAIAFDTITKENQYDVPFSVRLVTKTFYFKNSTKGYELFKTFSETKIDLDSLPLFVETYYANSIENEHYKEYVSKEVQKNISVFKEKEWGLDFILRRKLNPSYLDYIKHSEDFKIRVWSYKLVSSMNYSRNLKEQQKYAEELKEKIKKRLEQP